MRIAIVGASGRMGLSLLEAVADLGQLTAAISRVSVGECVSKIMGNKAPEAVIINSDLAAVVNDFDVVIDFTRPEISMQYVEICRQAGKKMVIGTTGYTDAQKDLIAKAAEEIAIVMSPNMSIGVNLSLKLLEMTAKVMGDFTDIEIIETHHRHKVDAPSGTALQMGETIANSLGRDLDACAVYNRQGIVGARGHDVIGFSSIRAGGIIAEHTVMFSDECERVEITHKAINRATFAHGSVKAANWLNDKDTGMYNMQDVLGLS